MKKIVVNLIILLVASLALAAPVQAVAFGASPAKLTYNLGKGQSQEQVVTITTNSQEYLDVSFSVDEGIKEFITVSPATNLKTSINDPLEFKITATASRFARSEAHEGAITFLINTDLADTGEGTGSAVSTGVAVKTAIDIDSTKVSEVIDKQKETITKANPISGQVTEVPSEPGDANILVLFSVIILGAALAILIVYLVKRGR